MQLSSWVPGLTLWYWGWSLPVIPLSQPWDLFHCTGWLCVPVWGGIYRTGLWGEGAHWFLFLAISFILQIDIDECEDHKCENNATCYDLTITDYDAASSLPYYCECEDGFQGEDKEFKSSHKDHNFSGEYCEENINDCQNHGCENGGQCIDGLGTFSCVCAPGFT